MAEHFDTIAQLTEESNKSRRLTEKKNELVTSSIREETGNLKSEIEQARAEKERLSKRLSPYMESLKEYGLTLRLISKSGKNGNDYIIEFKKGGSSYQLSLPGWQSNQFSMKLEDILETIQIGLKTQGNIEIKDKKKGGGFLEEGKFVGKDFIIGGQIIEKISRKLNPKNESYEEDKERWASQGGYIDYLKTLKTSIETLRTL